MQLLLEMDMVEMDSRHNYNEIQTSELRLKKRRKPSDSRSKNQHRDASILMYPQFLSYFSPPIKDSIAPF